MVETTRRTNYVLIRNYMANVLYTSANSKQSTHSSPVSVRCDGDTGRSGRCGAGNSVKSSLFCLIYCESDCWRLWMSGFALWIYIFVWIGAQPIIATYRFRVYSIIGGWGSQNMYIFLWMILSGWMMNVTGRRSLLDEFGFGLGSDKQGSDS